METKKIILVQIFIILFDLKWFMCSINTQKKITKQNYTDCKPINFMFL